MATLYIEFKGICVHFRWEDHPSLTVRHRVVMVNGTDISHPIRGAEIPPHYAVLMMPPELSMPIISLAGVTVRVRGQVDAPCVYQGTYALLPSLAALAASDGETLGPPSLPMLFGENPGLTSAYFDFNSGTFSACQDDESASVLAMVETDDGDTETVKLDLFPFATKPFPAVTLPQSYELPHESVITIANICDGTKDRDTDFYLSYLTAATVPQRLVVPPRETGLPKCPTAKQIAGPGCSDSTYP